MKNNVFYGEYSLKHWIDLVLKENIVLPPYQRHFVWGEKDVKELISAFKEKQFVPPITIGVFKIDSKSQNLILDGQQRLTSILLAYLGLFPKARTYTEPVITFVNENDDDDSEDEMPNKVIKWTFRALTLEGNTKDEICRKITEHHSDKYDSANYSIDEEFLKTTFLGFSYLVPNTDDDILQQKYYSTVFRNINIQGKPLLQQESRASLYFLNTDLEKFFAPDFCDSITVRIVNNVSQIDFVRCLSLLSQYHKEGNANRIARGYKPQMESFYEKYIYSTVNDEASVMFGQFSTFFPNGQYESRFERLKQTIRSLGIQTQYESIIGLDMYFFGLVYEVIFNNKEIENARKEDLIRLIDEKVSEFRANSSHAKSPNNLGHLRNRIEQSVTIYSTFSKDLSTHE